jgi:hypothetical protein
VRRLADRLRPAYPLRLHYPDSNLLGAVIFINSSNGVFQAYAELWLSVLCLFLLIFFPDSKEVAH